MGGFEGEGFTLTRFCRRQIEEFSATLTGFVLLTSVSIDFTSISVWAGLPSGWGWVGPLSY